MISDAPSAIRPGDEPAEMLRDVLARGVDEAIISREQAERLAALATRPGGPSDDEHLRFVTGFADIFVTIGILLFVGAASMLTHGLSDGDRPSLGAGYAITAVISWALAEIFTRRRRMALPSIVLLLLFAGMSFTAVAYAAGDAVGTAPFDWRRPTAMVVAACATLLLAGLHYWRFRVPVTVAAGAAALVVASVSFGMVMWRDAMLAHLNAILVAAGIAVFALAMRFDLSDPGRVTRRSDIAFWLHLLAAPLIVHPMVNGFLKRVPGGAAAVDPEAAVLAWSGSLSVLAIVLSLSLVALVIDRRALLVSGLAYAGYSLSHLIGRLGGESFSVALSLLALGAFVLLLSVGWRPMRQLLLRRLPAPLSRRLPHPIGP